MDKYAKIFVAGHQGLLGAALIKKLEEHRFSSIVTASTSFVDFSDFHKLKEFFEQNRPEYVFLAAGRTGGIHANKTYPAEFLNENLKIQSNFFQLAQEYDVRALVFYASSCVYPKYISQPISETSLLTGTIEATSQAYGASKIAGILGCWAFNEQYKKTQYICLLPNSMYGPHDNFSSDDSHVLGALIQKIHMAKITQQDEVLLWGTGTPLREFIFSDDVAEASIFAVQNRAILKNEHYNVGSGEECSIQALAQKIAEIVGYSGRVIFDINKSDGTSRKFLDSSRFLSLGWKPRISLEEGIKITYAWYVAHCI